MAIYKNISSATTETLITKGGITSGAISRITIANHDNSDLVIVKLYLHDGAGSPTIYTITEVTIPPLATLVLDDNLSFDSSKYNLKIDTSTTAEITVIIK
jgi:hypothetical protein|tara:strand:+ start:286 stop:585 length:300 start_codon:yes stop_codon:yes gene_type:complete